MTPAFADFFAAFDAFCAARGISDARGSTLVFNDGGRIGDIRAGSDVGVKRLERALGWLSDNWPPDADWPRGVARPAPGAAARDADARDAEARDAAEAA